MSAKTIRERTRTGTIIFFGLLLGMAAVVGSVRADLTDNFDPPNVHVTADQSGSAPGPAVLPAGPTGQFLRLVNDGANSQNNSYSYERTDAGAFSTFTADFDFRTSSVTGEPADGFAFIMLPTSVYGTSGSGHLGIAFEEPNIASTAAFGFDIWRALDGVNDVSFHHNGAEIRNTRLNPTTEIDLDAGVFHRAHVEVQQVGNGSTVLLQLTPDVHGAVPGATITPISLYRPGLLPYENRIQFGARTGGANMDVDLDNIDVQYSNPYVPLPVINSTTLIQDFDSAGTTPYTPVQLGSSPGPTPVTGGPTGAFLRLINDGVNSQVNNIAFDRGPDGGVSNMATTVEFDFRGESVGADPADGFSLSMLPTDTYGRVGQGSNPSPAEEPNKPGVLAIGFDLYPPGTNEVSLHYDASVIAEFAVNPADVDLDAGAFHRAELTTEWVAGGSNVTLTVTPDVHGSPGTPVTIFANQHIPGLKPFDYRLEFAGRTGGLNMNVDLDNISTDFIRGPSTAVTQQGFEDPGGTNYKAYADGTVPGPALMEDVPTGNVFLRLLHDNTGNQWSTLGFERPTVQQQDRIKASFDYRIPVEEGYAGAERADGFGFALLDTNEYGPEGAPPANWEMWVDTPDPHSVVWERPHLPDALAIGFDIYAGQMPDYDENTITLNYDGVELLAFYLDPAIMPINNGVFNHVDLLLEDDGTDALATLIITPDIFGTAGAPITIFQDELVPGLDLDTFDFRGGFGGRTGGEFISLDLDNVYIEAVPEPSSIALLLSLLAGVSLAWALRRRR